MRRLLPIAALGALACAPEPDSASRTEGPEPGVVCAGASLREATMERHPAVVRGIVRAPKVESNSSWLPQLVPSAHAFPMEFEKPVGRAPVRVFALGASEPLVSTTTDAQGRYCVRVPDGHVEANLRLEADVPGATLRHLLVHRADASLDAQSEARWRVLEARGVDLGAIAPERYLNWRTVADTEAGLLGGVEQDEPRSIDVLIAQVVEALERSERVRGVLGK